MSGSLRAALGLVLLVLDLDVDGFLLAASACETGGRMLLVPEKGCRMLLLADKDFRCVTDKDFRCVCLHLAMIKQSDQTNKLKKVSE